MTLRDHGGWKTIIKAAKITPSEMVIESIREFVEAHCDKLTEAVLAEKKRADEAEAKLARVQSYRDTCVILGNNPSTAGLIRALRSDDEPVRRAHNHPPSEPTCKERTVSGVVRGACLTDDGRDIQ